MTNYVVTTRNKVGALEERAYTAENRADLFKQLAADGITAVRIAEGVPGKKPRKASSGGGAKIPFKTVGLVAASLVALIAAVVIIMSLTTPSDSEVDPAPRKELAEDASPSQPSEVSLPQSDKGELKAEGEVKKPVDTRPLHEQVVETISVITNADGSVLERFKTADGKIRSRQSAPRSVFDNPSDQLIAMAIHGGNSTSGMPPMPISSSAEEDFVKSLEKPIVINPDDSEEVKQLKQSVMKVRAEIDQLMKEGKSFSEIMKEHQALVNENASVRKDVEKGLKELVDQGDFEAAQEYLNKMNPALEELGVMPLEMPETREERRQRIREQSLMRRESSK